jgi:hypothetical protein
MFTAFSAVLALGSGRLQAQQPPTGKTPTRQTPATQTPTGKTPLTQTPVPNYPSSWMWGRTPWFYNDNVRRELNMTEQQYNRLQQNYDRVYVPFEKDLVGLDRLSPQERAARAQQLYNKFGTDYSKSAADVLNPHQMTRWRQLELQARGYGAFADSSVLSKLNLNDNQVQQLNALAQHYNQKLDAISRDSQPDRAEVARRYQDLRKESIDRLGEILTPQQQRAWTEMTGQPVVISPNFGTPVPKRP